MEGRARGGEKTVELLCVCVEGMSRGGGEWKVDP